MSTRKSLLTPRLSLLVGAAVLASPAAKAAPPLEPPFAQYAAKFVCGPITADEDVVEGVYATSINIHNPQATLEVGFVKKFVVANQEGTTLAQPVVKRDNLLPDLAERVDCPVIYAALERSAQSHVEGFLIIEVPPVSTTGAAGGASPLLDVIGKYTARQPTSEVQTLDIVVYSPEQITL